MIDKYEVKIVNVMYNIRMLSIFVGVLLLSSCQWGSWFQPNSTVSSDDPQPPAPAACAVESGVTKGVVVGNILESYPPQYVVRADDDADYRVVIGNTTQIVLEDGSAGTVDTLSTHTTQQGASGKWEITGDWQRFSNSGLLCDGFGQVQAQVIRVLQ